MMSWRNPDERHADWGLDTYGQAVLDAMDAVERATGERAGRRSRRSAPAASSPRWCWPTWPRPAGRTGWPRLSLAVTVLDWARAGTVSALMDEESVKAATEKSRKKGYLDGAQLAEVFAWLRPNDLVWNYWVNNYLQGKPPPNFDILFWNADTTRMSAGLHRDFIDIAIGNALTEPGRATMLGTPVDLSTVDRRLLRHRRHRRPPLPVAGLLPHHPAARRGQPVRPVDQRAHRLAGQPAGQPEVDLPGRRRRRPADPEEWLAAAETVQGSWWPDFMTWLGERSGEEIPAPTSLGGELEELAPAPGHLCLRQVARPGRTRRYVRTVTVGRPDAAGRRSGPGRTRPCRRCC